MGRKEKRKNLTPEAASRGGRDRPVADFAPGPSDPPAGAGWPRPLISSIPGARTSRTLDLVIVLAIAAVCAAVYASSIHGAFVYDDERQIVVNTLIQDSHYFWKAMTSDVWAFKGAGEEAVSNYWRPAFVLWLIVNYRLFGLESTTGWHALNILLHAIVCGLVYILARRFGLARPLSSAIALLFAVHPAHVESVAWISGSPDLLLSIGMIGSLLLVISARARPSSVKTAGALLLYALAQLSKEVAIFFPVIVCLVVATEPAGMNRMENWRDRWKRAALAASPFAALAVVYFAARVVIVGKVSRNITDAPGLTGTILSAPSIAAFYLRQIVFPWWIGPSYPLRAVRAGGVDLANFFLPAVIVAAALAGTLLLARRSRIAAIGLAFLTLPLIPAFNINVFLPEHIVHDRYLYLPLLGALLIVVPLIASLASLALRAGARAAWIALAISAAMSLPLAVETLHYGVAWTGNLVLWQWGTLTDPSSAFSESMLGIYLRQAGRLPEARAAFDRALAITPVTSAYLGRAEINVAEKRFADAESDLRQVLESYPDHYQAWERLAVCYERAGRVEDAAKALREARGKIPAKRCTLTEMLSVVLYQAGRKAEAVSELEAVRGQVRNEYDPGARLVLYRLGLLYGEAGKKAEASAALREYLDLTRDLQDPPTLQTRSEAQKVLARISGG